MSISIVPSGRMTCQSAPPGRISASIRPVSPAAGDRDDPAMADPGGAVILQRPERGRHLERGLETGDRRDGDHEASGRTKPDS